MQGSGNFPSALGPPPEGVPTGPITRSQKRKADEAAGELAGRQVKPKEEKSPEAELLRKRKPELPEEAVALTARQVKRKSSKESPLVAALKADLLSLADDIKDKNAPLARKITELAGDIKSEADLEKTVSELMKLLKQKELPVTFQHMLQALEMFPKGERAGALGDIASLIKGISDSDERSDILKILGLIPDPLIATAFVNVVSLFKGISAEQRSAIYEAFNLLECGDSEALANIVALFRGIGDGPGQRAILEALERVSQRFRRAYVIAVAAPFYGGISSGSERAAILEPLGLISLDLIDISQKDVARAKIVAIFRDISVGKLRENILKALKLMPEDHRFGVLAEIVSLFRDIADDSKRMAFIFSVLNLTPEGQRADVIGHLAQICRADIALLSDVYNAFLLLPKEQSARDLANVIALFRGLSDAALGRDIREDLIRQASIAEYISQLPFVSQRVAILAVLDLIPQEQRAAALANMVALFRDLSDAALRENIFAALIHLPHEQIAGTLANVISELRDISDVHQRVAILRTFGLLPQEPAYEVTIRREELRTIPLAVLHNLCSQFSEQQKSVLEVTFAGEVGVDVGGVGRDFITGLFDGIREKMKFLETENGLYRPVLSAEGEPLSDEDRKVYNQIGQLLMFCLNATEEYPIGMLLDVGVFTVLTRLKVEHLERGFDNIIADDKMFDEMYAIYSAQNRNNEAEVQKIARMNEYLKPLTAETPEKVLKDLFAAVLYEDEVERLKIRSDDTEKIREQYPALQAALRKTIANNICLALAPIFEIAKGMKDAPFQSKVSWQELQHMTPGTISERLQGTVTRAMIIEKLRFSEEVAPEQQKWIKNWILKADKAKIKQFLFSMTGASALGRKGLLIKNISSGLPVFRTCFNEASLPLGKSEDEFVKMLERSIAGEEGFSIG